MLHHRFVLTWKSHDQVHIDIIKATLSCKFKRLLCFLYRMSASDDIQCLLVHGLWIYRNPRDRVISDHHQFFSGDTVRSSCLDRKFHKVLAVKMFHKGIKQDFQLFWFQSSRCSASDVDSVQFFTLLSHNLRDSFDFFAQSLKIQIYPVLPLFQRIRAKRTVKADTRAERDSDIKTVTILIINVLQDFPLSVCDRDRQCSFLGADHVAVSHFLRCFCVFHSGLNKSHCQLRRTDPGQVSPWKGFARQADQ